MLFLGLSAGYRNEEGKTRCFLHMSAHVSAFFRVRCRLGVQEDQIIAMNDFIVCLFAQNLLDLGGLMSNNRLELF